MTTLYVSLDLLTTLAARHGTTVTVLSDRAYVSDGDVTWWAVVPAVPVSLGGAA